ncbi:MAG: BolA/IbaG family iron-sulfur metabolism protein [Agarilytica sp.]
MTMRETITKKLKTSLAPTYMEVLDESHGHNVAEGAESHFKVTLVSDAFTGLMAVKRHQKAYQILSAELAGSVHALALHLYTPEEWQARQGRAPESPPCLGGSKAG